MMYGYGLGWGSMMGWGIFGLWSWLLVVGLLAFVLVRLVGGSSDRSSSRALEILNERYAKGEISTTEYQERKKALGL